jgi:hypothetical protein
MMLHAIYVRARLFLQFHRIDKMKILYEHKHNAFQLLHMQAYNLYQF